MSEGQKREPDQRAMVRGKKILDARRKLGFSQEYIATQLGVTRESMSNWERGTVGEIERRYRLGLCKLLGFDEIELLLDKTGAQAEFDVPLSREAKSIAHRWDDLPESERVRIKLIIAEAERLIAENPELAKRIYPDLAES
jgi:transcriptional regulator with XRE-family HTH domain